MSVDVDAVNERLNGLVTLLQAVGVDSIDKNDLDRVSKNFKSGGGGGGGADMALPDARQLNDDQIEAIIKKLQLAQAEAPQIIAALEAHAEARSLTGSNPRQGGGQQQQQHRQPPQQQEEEDDDEEEDDEFDEDANYPMVGPGCSDDISVVSDMTTPTVVSSLHVPEEEHYRETLPPMLGMASGGGGMMVGGGQTEMPPMMIQPTKKKNLVNQVRPGQHIGAMGGQPASRRNMAPPTSRAGGAAAARRKNYQDTMAKLHENPHSMGFAGPSAAKKPSSAQAARQPKASSSSHQPKPSSSSKSKSRKPREAENFSDFAANRQQESWAGAGSANTGGGGGGGGGGDWNAFDSKPVASKPTVIDDDGFLVGESFDPFGSNDGGNNPFKGNKSAAGDLAFGSSGRDPFGSNSSAGGNPRKSRSSKDRGGSGGGGKQRVSSGGSTSSGEGRPRGTASGGRRRGRRASLGM